MLNKKYYIAVYDSVYSNDMFINHVIAEDDEAQCITWNEDTHDRVSANNGWRSDPKLGMTYYRISKYLYNKYRKRCIDDESTLTEREYKQLTK